MQVEYASNNSGGSWWLEDKDWVALEQAGWRVQWGGLYFCHSTYRFSKAPVTAPQPCSTNKACHGHRRFETVEAAIAAGPEGRWLGALAKTATKEFATLADAVREFEQITGQNAADEGCNCCGAPHSFSTDTEHVSGDDIIALLYGPDAPTTLREAVERLKGQ